MKSKSAFYPEYIYIYIYIFEKYNVYKDFEKNLLDFTENQDVKIWTIS